jgi:Ran GTPase-activating protein (RanGAP) involved in mRNA processing and transport
MEGEARTHARELLQAHFENMGSTETEAAVVQRYRTHGLAGAAGIVAWPRRGDTTLQAREETGRVPRVRFNPEVGFREATLAQMQTALARMGVLYGEGGHGAAGRAPAARALTLLDMPGMLWEHTDDSAVKLMRTSKTLRLALERREPGATEPGKPTMSVRLNRAWYEALGGAPRTPRLDSVLAELLRTSAACSVTTLELRRVRLNGTEDALATAVSRSTALTRLCLADCWINEEGCRRLAQALLPCTKLVELDLGANQLGEGVADVADVLPALPSLAVLILNKAGPHRAGRAAGERLALALAQCRALTRLDVNALFGSADGFPMEPVVAALPQCPSLVHLDLGWNTCDADADAPAAGAAEGGLLARSLARCPGLRHLDLSCCRLNHETLAQLGATDALTGLSRLTLTFNVIPEAAARSLGTSLAHCTSLRELNVSACGRIERLMAGLGPGLAECAALQRLDANSFILGEAECRAALTALRATTSLTELHMNHSQTRQERLRSSMEWTVALGLAEVLPDWPTLRHLDVGMSNFYDSGVVRLMAAHACTALTELNLNSNRIGDVGGLALAEALPRLTALTRLDLSTNTLGVASACALAAAMPACSALTSLDLFGMSVCDPGWTPVVAALVRALPLCTGMQALDLRSNYGLSMTAQDERRLRAAWQGPRAGLQVRVRE